jgi:hypothetical protein
VLEKAIAMQVIARNREKWLLVTMLWQEIRKRPKAPTLNDCIGDEKVSKFQRNDQENCLGAGAKGLCVFGTLLGLFFMIDVLLCLPFVSFRANSVV